MENFVDSSFKKNIGVILYKLRIENEVSRKELSYELRISLNSITSLENGKSIPTLETLFRYSIYFGINISYIIERVETYE